MTAEFSKELSEAQMNALKNLSEDPDRHLSLPLRKSIWLEMGPKFAGQSLIHSELGRLRRVKLAQLSVVRVLDLWLQKWPADQGPERILQLTHELITNSLDPKIAQLEKDLFWAHLESLAC